MNNFSELSLCPQLRDNLARNRFVEPTAVQAQAIPAALEGRDIVATAQTGTGKTLAFVLPMIEKLLSAPTAKGLRAVILTPTRELAIQISEVFATLAAGTGLRAAVVVGGMNEQRQLLALRQGAAVMVATPGRLCDFLNRKLVKMGGVATLVLDEADRMLDMGFLPSIKLILASMPAERQTLFFSATSDPTVAHLIKEYLRDPVRIAVGQPTKPCEQVDLHVYEVEQDRKLSLLNHMLRSEEGSFLVFSRTKHGAERLSKKLAVGGVKATAIHGDRTQNQRNLALRGFQQGQYRVLVATDVAARGIHVEGISHVVNFDLPQAPEDFIHRVGRTGRAGAHGHATTFSTRGERSEIKRIERLIKMQLNRREVPASVEREEKAPVIVIPVQSRTKPAASARPVFRGRPQRKAQAAR